MSEQVNSNDVGLSVWDTLKQGAPELALVPAASLSPTPKWDNYPGLTDWLCSQYALGWPSSRIKAHLLEIREGQQEDGAQVWPELSKRDIDRYRSDLRVKWVPVRDRLSSQIENAGVLAKNNRLIALARTADELEQMMFDERNSRTGELYLVSEFRATLRQIAEEKGELGELQGAADNTLLRIAESLATAIKLQGSGMQKQIVEGEWDYAEDEAVEATPVQGEGSHLQGDGVQAE